MKRESRPRTETLPPFRVGECIIRPDLHRIEKAGQVIQVEPRVMQVLTCLARRRGKVLSRDALLEEVWHDVVVSDEGLTVAISELRRVLGDDPRCPKFIETIRKGGYRLIAPVEPVLGAAAARPAARRRWIVPLAALVAVAGLLALRVFQRAAEADKVLLGVPLTVSPGVEFDPALSSDGTRVAFAWSGPGGENTDIYVKQKGSDTTLRLTSHPAAETLPSWSPDGAAIAFHRGQADRGIYVVPSLGGSERRLVAPPGPVFGIDWSPDGQALVYSAGDSVGGLGGLRVVDLATLEVRNLTDPARDYSCDYAPRFSPDGRTIAFARSQHPTYEQDVFIIRASGGTPRRLTAAQRTISGLAWTRSGKEILFAAAPTGESCLWRVGLQPHDPLWVPTVGYAALDPTTARSADVIVYREMSYEFDIWRVGLSDAGLQPEDRPLVESTRSDYRPCWSPRGDRIAFVSTRSGQREIWMCDAEGRDAQQITSSTENLTGSLCWSPDARGIAYSAVCDGREAAYLVELESRRARRIRPAARHQVVVAWSGDGAWIYFNTQRDGKWQVARMRSDGSAEEELGPSGCTMTALLPNPERIVYMAKDLTGLWLMSPATAQTEFFIEDRTAIAWSSWAVTEGGAYFIRRDREGHVLGWYDSASKESRILGPVSGQVVCDLCLSPDGRSVLFARTDRLEADLIRVERFR